MKRRFFANSVILHTLDRGADRLYDAMANSAAGRGLTSYGAEDRGARKSLIATRASMLLSRLNIRKIKLFFARSIEESVLCGAVHNIFARLAATFVRQYGVFMFAFGFYGALMYILTNYVIDSMKGLPLYYAVIDGVMIAVSLPLMLSRHRMSDTISRSRLANILFFDFLGLRRESLAEYAARGKRSNFSFVLGTAAGLLTLVISPVTGMLAALGLVAAYLVLTTPETGLVLVVLLIPFAPPAVLGAIIVYINICYLIKVMRGKRTLRLDLKDYTVILFAFIVLFAGLVSLDPKSSFSYSVKMMFYVFSYVLIVNMIKSRKWLSRIRSALIVSCVAVSIFGLLQKLGAYSSHFLSEDFRIDKEITGPFSSSDILAVYLAMCVFFLIAEFLQNDKPIRKLFMLILCIGTLFCLWFTESPVAIISWAAACCIFFLIYSNRTVYFLLVAAVGVLLVIYLMPSDTSPISKLSQGLSEHISSNSALWKASSEMAREYVWSGGGLGTFRTLIQPFLNESVSFAADSSSMYIQMMVELGISGVLVFGLSTFLFIQNSFGVFASRGGGKRNVDCAAGLCGVAATLLTGTGIFVWADERIFLCFWVIMGISVAAGELSPMPHKNELFEAI